jgi:hypothetical protein
MEIAESFKKKRKLGPENGGNGGKKKGGREKNGKSCFCSSKFAAIKKDLKSMIRDKRDSYNILFIRFSLFERWINETIMQNDDNIL